MSIASDMIRGHTDTIILAQLMKGDNYGYEINKTIYELSDHSYEMKEATLYTAFRRLEQLGYITFYWGDGELGARRKYYSITETGRAAYRKLSEEWCSAKGIIDRLITDNRRDI